MSKQLKYKEGDVVRIKSKEWWDSMPKNEYGDVKTNNSSFTKEMSSFCGGKAVVRSLRCNYYKLDVDDMFWNWIDDMLEDIPTPIKKHSIQRRKYSKIGQSIY